MHLAQVIHQKPTEDILHRLRRHPLTFIPIITLFLVLLAVPFGVYFLISTIYPTLLQGDILYPVTVLAGSMYMLTIYLFLYVRFIDYYLDLWIVTNERIVDIEQEGLFTRTITEVDMFRIQDVTVEVHGIFATIFNFGNVHVQTASMNADIIFYNVPHPNKIRQKLVRLAEIDREQQNGLGEPHQHNN